MAKARGRQGDTKDGIISIGFRFILDSSYRAFQARQLIRGPAANGNDCEDLAFQTLEVILYCLTTSPELMGAISEGDETSLDHMGEKVADAIAMFEGRAEAQLVTFSMMERADKALDRAFDVGNRRSRMAEHAVGLLKMAIGVVAARAWYRPRVEVGPPESGKRRRRYLTTINLSTILEALRRSSEGEFGNEGDLARSSDDTESQVIRIDLRSARISGLEWAVFEAYAIDDDATLELLAARDWPGDTKLTFKQIRGILSRTKAKLVKALGPGYSEHN